MEDSVLVDYKSTFNFRRILTIFDRFGPTVTNPDERQIVYKWVTNPQLTSGGLQIPRNNTNADCKSWWTEKWQKHADF